MEKAYKPPHLNYKLYRLGGPIGTLSLVIFHKVIGQAVTHFRLLHVWMLIGLGVLIIYVYQYSLSLFHGH
ncbi:hypothetical protein J2W44_005066 [Priestia aryabhattai]|uniref:hypothetical protein n=1 Tax=Priestia aryabhattai TaxID=412384 RepID=UPI0026C80F6B|nr:hypothetical protein [Priestia aryabhattai]MDP9725964.1 hypothetical protein [Priestia aryabhattai]